MQNLTAAISHTGPDGGQVSGAAERLHPAVPGADAGGGPLEGRAPTGGGHEPLQTGPLHLWPPVPLCQLLRAAAHLQAPAGPTHPACPAAQGVLAGKGFQFFLGANEA